ncbi:hypothetical protein [Kordiimonas pumila]|uniref:HEAT repeat domain-containing protein n=1 Tax=Kordiimonas pumila TaxID=2161677 RepID=A0ABV7D994_9PROT|nr:hypothetical protein [Kordiimonas pumila]
MNKILFAVCLLSATVGVEAQQVPVTSEHKPNSYTLACLASLTKDCAVKAAIQTVIDEDFGAERAKVLIGVARAMLGTGQAEQAAETLILALDEARSVNISLVTQEKITSIAPLLAEAGDVAGGLALVQELSQDTVRDKTLINIAEKLIKAGNISGAKVALDQVTNESRAFWRFLGLLPLAPNGALTSLEFDELEVKVQALTDKPQQYRGFIRLAVIAGKAGDEARSTALIAVADEMFPSVVGMQARATVTGERARLMYQAGLDAALVETSYNLAILHGTRVQGQDARIELAHNVGPIEAATGKTELALKRLEYFTNETEKAGYLASLSVTDNAGQVAAAITDFLGAIEDVEGAYDRDIIRLTLLEGVLKSKNKALAITIIKKLEDDDNQAYGLALLAPLLA